MLYTILGILVFAITITLIAGRVVFLLIVGRQKRLLFHAEDNSEKITETDLEQLPLLLKNYLKRSGVIGRSKFARATFRQKGTIKTNQKEKWLSFKAVQHMASRPGGFIWSARSFPIFIMDSYFRGKGTVRVNLLGLKDLAVFSTPETNQSALGRYFGELIWYPIGFLDKAIVWQEVDAATVKGTMTKDGLAFEGYFHFTKSGEIHSFTGKRYRDETLEEFRGTADAYTTMDGLLIPKKMTAIWEMESGPLEYFKATIEDYRVIE